MHGGIFGKDVGILAGLLAGKKICPCLGMPFQFSHACPAVFKTVHIKKCISIFYEFILKKWQPGDAHCPFFQEMPVLRAEMG